MHLEQFGERPKTLLKVSLIDVDSACQQEAKTIKFIHLLKSCGEAFQGSPDRVLKWRLEDANLKIIWILRNTLLLYYFLSYFTECVAWNTEKLGFAYFYSFGESSCGCPQNLSRKDVNIVTSLVRPQDVNFELLIFFNLISPNVCLKH